MRLEISFSRPDSCRRRDKVSCIDFAFEDWDMPVPRIGERVWHKGLEELEDDDADSEWRVVDVWWEPDADDCDDIGCEPQPHCVVMAELVGVEPDSDEDIAAYKEWYFNEREASAVQASTICDRCGGKDIDCAKCNGTGDVVSAATTERNQDGLG